MPGPGQQPSEEPLPRVGSVEVDCVPVLNEEALEYVARAIVDRIKREFAEAGLDLPQREPVPQSPAEPPQ